MEAKSSAGQVDCIYKEMGSINRKWESTLYMIRHMSLWSERLKNIIPSEKCFMMFIDQYLHNPSNSHHSLTYHPPFFC